ncbi:MAG: cytochrome c [Proteobacteria bacterium]|nr:MAG: cytochrome c [Pseudomonadota bacterium]
MSQRFTKSTARNIFYGGSLFFILLFLVLTFDSHRRFPESDNRANMTELAAEGKRLWEINNCIGCHTLLGEGAYYAPELGNAYQRLGGEAGIKAFIMTRPKDGIPGRRSMPQFNFNEEELNAIAEFLKYVSEIDAAGWPPNIQG